jgi:hypothetical protein
MRIKILLHGRRRRKKKVAAYMIFGGEDGGVGAVEPGDELGHAIPHLAHPFLARERFQHEVSWNKQRDCNLGFLLDMSREIRV